MSEQPTNQMSSASSVLSVSLLMAVAYRMIWLFSLPFVLLAFLGVGMAFAFCLFVCCAPQALGLILIGISSKSAETFSVLIRRRRPEVAPSAIKNRIEKRLDRRIDRIGDSLDRMMDRVMLLPEALSCRARSRRISSGS